MSKQGKFAPVVNSKKTCTSLSDSLISLSHSVPRFVDTLPVNIQWDKTSVYVDCVVQERHKCTSEIVETSQTQKLGLAMGLAAINIEIQISAKVYEKSKYVCRYLQEQNYIFILLYWITITNAVIEKRDLNVISIFLAAVK